MRIHYRVTGEQIEIIRCFGTDPQIVLPERIEGLPVVRTAAYALCAEHGTNLTGESPVTGIYRQV